MVPVVCCVMCELRTFIRSVIAEAAIDTTHASMSYLALCVSPTSAGRCYVLYDPAKFVEIMRWSQKKIRAHAIVPCIVAMIEIKSASEGHTWNASVVELAAAERGYGPLMYDIVMASEGGLMADRGSVSKSAQRVWQYYKNSRPDVVAKPLDDESDPKTEPTIDDAEVYDGGGDNPLNYAYFATKHPNTKQLESNHMSLVHDMLLGSDVKKKDTSMNMITQYLLAGAREFFARMYF